MFASAARSFVLFCIATLGAVGCAAPTFKHDEQFLRDHVIMVDGKGRPHDPSSPDGRELNITEYRSQLASMFRSLRDYHRAHPQGRVLLFVHGGLNTPAESLTNADNEIDDAQHAGYYAIYLNWNSSALDSYGEHVASITQGQTDVTFGRRLLIPFYILADVGRAAVRLPIVWVKQGASDVAGAAGDFASIPKRNEMPVATVSADQANQQRWARGRRGQALAQTYEQLRKRAKDEQRTGIAPNSRQEFQISIGPDLDVNPGHMAGLAFGYILTSPIKYASQPLIDWIGTPAWQNMSRRTLMAFDGDLGGNPSDPDPDKIEFAGHREARGKNAVDFTTTGAFEIFREHLERFVEHATTQPTDKLDVTLIAHSMGTMVLNEWIRRDLLESNELSYSRIVYMAAACSVRDFSRAIVPYLLKHPDTEFYNLMLHPLADLRERKRLGDLPPSGSLLVWLDDFLTDPQTPLDRTLGRWDNIIPATEVIPEKIRGRVTLKAFALAPSNPPPDPPYYGPQEHGEFRDGPYWSESFWSSEQTVAPTTNRSDVR